MKNIFIGILWIYQRTVSFLLPNRCRFYPSCSEYAKEAFNMNGLLYGGWQVFIRLLKCHPWHPGGVDVVRKY